MGLFKPKPGLSGEFGAAVTCNSCGSPAYANATCPKCGRDPLVPGPASARAPPAAPTSAPTAPNAPFAVEYRDSSAPNPRARAAAQPPAAPNYYAPPPPPQPSPYPPPSPYAAPPPGTMPEPRPVPEAPRGPQLHPGAQPANAAPPQAAAPPTSAPAAPFADASGEALVGVICQMGSGAPFDLIVTGRRVLCVPRKGLSSAFAITAAANTADPRKAEAEVMARYTGQSFDQIAQSDKDCVQIQLAEVERALISGGISAVTTPKLVFVLGRKKLGFEFLGSRYFKNKDEMIHAAGVLRTVLGDRIEVKGV